MSHHNIRSDNSLSINIILRGKLVFGAIYMRAEHTAVLAEFTDRAKGKNLKTTAVSKDRSVPTLKFMQASCSLQDIQSGSKVKVIGIPQNNLSLDILLQVVVVNSLNGAHRSHRHKNRSMYSTVIGLNPASSGRRSAILTL